MTGEQRRGRDLLRHSLDVLGDSCEAAPSGLVDAFLRCTRARTRLEMCPRGRPRKRRRLERAYRAALTDANQRAGRPDGDESWLAPAVAQAFDGYRRRWFV